MIDSKDYATTEELKEAMINESNKAVLSSLNNQILGISFTINSLEGRLKYLNSEKTRLEKMISEYENGKKENT